MLSLRFIVLFAQTFFCSSLSLPRGDYNVSEHVAARVYAASIETSAALTTSTSLPQFYNCLVPTSTGNPTSSQLATTTNPASSLSFSTPSMTRSTSSPPPAASALTNTSDPDLLIIASRRIDFISAQQQGANSLSAWLSTLGADGKWPDSEVNYTAGCAAQRASWPAADHWVRIAALAAAWHGGFAGASSTFVNSSALRSQIGLAMDWWFDLDFTLDSCLDHGGIGTCPCSTPGLWDTNWFSNVVLVPRLVGQTCLFLNTTLTSSQLSHCISITARSFDVFQRPTKPSFLVGSNALDIASIGISHGVITQNVSVVEDAYGRVHDAVQVMTGIRVDGVLADGSFGQHNGLLYNGNYGKDYANDVLELEIEAAGTRLAATGSSRAAFESLMNASQWMIYQNTITRVPHWDYTTEGRYISSPVSDSDATAGLNMNLTEIKQLGSLWNSSFLQEVYTNLTTQNSTANLGGLVGNRYFWNNDYMVTRGINYVSTLKMYSSRTRNAECINSQNPFGFHLADGTMYTYVRGDEYEDIAAVWDWDMIPGTTVDYGGTALKCSNENLVGVENFVGGGSTGKLGAAAMRYTNPVTKAFSFQKVWFYFDNDVQHVMVSVLNHSSNAPVISVLDQRKRDGPIYVDLDSVSSGNFSHSQTLFHAYTGYFFHNSFAYPAPELSIVTGNCTGAWNTIGPSSQPPATTDLFRAWIPHNPSDVTRSVAYTVFPGRTQTEFNDEVSRISLQTLSSDTRMSAVHDSANGTTMVVFWQPEGGAVSVPSSWSAGTPGVDIVSDSALLMILDQKTWTVTVSDPTQLLVKAHLTFTVQELLPCWGNDRKKIMTVVFQASSKAGSSISLPLV